MLFEKVIRPALYQVGGGDPELVHERSVAALRKLSGSQPLLTALRARYRTEVPTTVFGVRFANPIGLAAGMDKDGQAIPAWAALGFGFVEVGTVTRLAQPGNPKPRLFQLPRSRGVINRMGFNNAGADALAERLAAGRAPSVPLGISIGKSKLTPMVDAVADYLYSLRVLYPHASYFAVNVSSPNTPGLRTLQDKGALTELLSALASENSSLAAALGRAPTPLLVKLAPDLTNDAIIDLLDVCHEHGVDGVIATNTTLSRDQIHPTETDIGQEQGGLSGQPLRARALEVVRFIHDRTEGTLPIIGVGGIGSVDDAARMMDAGASLLQLYTGFIYSGPALVRSIARGLTRNR